jgi:hypothetical protein
MVVPICNPSYLGGWEDHEFKASLAAQRYPISKINNVP